ncbi:MAG: N-acetylglucosaminyl-diphospho-decaprenol L-rhamnosyltransferase [Syntrophaceae bacterium PtaB.Bin038]|nr:MAG: N-acetylglucosaminyl-diphospho-decaprenol L-rhamnosyltransferase [Syntrophaceae bacterium PtaB.Bin038]
MDLSIIIVNWNTEELLRNCLRSVYSTIEGLDFEVIVVDNASGDGSVAMLKVEFPQVRRIENYENRGFAAANNQAFRAMAGRYALLLNSDAVLTEGAVRELFVFMEDHPEAVMACGQLLNADGSKQTSVARFPTIPSLLLNMPLLETLFPDRYPSKRRDYSHPIEVDSCIGACLMVRKSAIDGVGGFDERYFFFFEETDWARTMRQAGGKIYHVPSARIYHLQGKSIGTGVRSRMHFYRSRYLYFMKWESPARSLLAAVLIVVRLVGNWGLTGAGVVLTLGLSRGLREKWKLYSQLIAWHLKGCP